MHTVLKGRVRFFFVSEAKISIFDQYTYSWIRTRVIWNILLASNGNFSIEADKIFSFTPNHFQETICSSKVPILAPDTKFKPMFCSEAVWLADQEKILALLAAWSFDRKPTAECGNFSIENVISITKKQALKAVSVFWNSLKANFLSKNGQMWPTLLQSWTKSVWNWPK